MITPGSAINDEFPGYYHYHDVDMRSSDVPRKVFTLPDGKAVPRNGATTDISKSIVTMDTWANAFSPCSDGEAVYHYKSNSSYDTFIRKTNSTQVDGALATPDKQFLKFYSPYEYLEFKIPPQLIFESCEKDERCIGFTVQNDKAMGSLLTVDIPHTHCPVYFATPDHFSRPPSSPTNPPALPSPPIASAATAASPATLEPEFPGYYHYPNVDMRTTPRRNEFVLPCGNQIKPTYSAAETDLVKNVITQDSKFNTFYGCGSSELLRYQPDPSFDSYLRKGNWTLQTGALATPDMKFLHRSYVRVRAYLSFSIPPQLIFESCENDEKCIGFTVANNGSCGSLLTDDEVNGCPKWFATPDHFNRP
jgi:hypothetical protein